MKLTLVANRLAPAAPTGVDRYLRLLAEAMSRRDGVRCSVAATPEAVEPDWVPANVTVRRLPGPRPVAHLAWCVARRPRIDRHAGHPDVVHVTFPAFPIPAEAPVLYTVHDLMPIFHPEWFGRVHRVGFRLAVRDAARHAAALIAVSASTARHVVETLGVDPARVAVIPTGLAPRFLELLPPGAVERATAAYKLEAGEYLLYVGEVSRRKNVIVLARALARCAGGPVLAIAGPEGDATPALREEIGRLGLTRRVRLLGYVPDDLLPGLLAGARALLQPSVYEGFGMTPLEAMAVGTPAVVAGRTALPGTVGDAALVVEPNDVSAWASAIDSTADPTIRHELTRRGRARAEQFNFEHVAGRTLDLYRAVIEGRALTP